MVDGQETQAFRYTLRFAACNPLQFFHLSAITVRERVWIDTHTGLFVKRVGREDRPDRSVFEFQESYSDWRLEEPVEYRAFRIERGAT